ncbi:zinc-dependent metalloprotease [Actinomadura geliboluensis]|uniref:Zinc-dependent metalloprotease n=1 Tax=Actinomadura geliboluensis TaxID=882440 RepID=A0A5S4H7V5_9ACTN|nr:zinc-dependent metalloprotease [Actinomadura geliboluensis]TMR40841.1 zinc-dependent metalloprotease [Actinomadura geliboluensis]
MSDTPFGFNRPGNGDDDDRPQDPFKGMGGDMAQFADMLHRFADMIGAQGAGGGGGGPLNWDLAKNIARHTVVEQGDPSVVDAERRQVVEALRLADLWLDERTTLPAGIRTPQAWSRSEWIEQTIPVWAKVCDPIATRMVDSMGGALGGGEIPADVQAMAGPLIGMVKQMAGAMVGGQAGQALGALAREVTGSADVGLPLAPDGVGALLPAGVEAFGQGLEVSDDEVRLYLALREAAHQRLFTHVPWLRSHLLGAVEEYARGITVDLSGIEQAVQGLDLSNPEALQEALGGEIQLQPEETPRQKAALARLETALALVEGWVETVVNETAEGRLPGSVKLAEAVRRRRATGGPAERTFATLVGLELRPRRLREAAALWRSLTEARGTQGRDAVWDHPDLLPTADDLDDPDGFVHGREEIEGLSDLDWSDLTKAPEEGGEPGEKGSDEKGSDEKGSDEKGPDEGDPGGGARPDDGGPRA